MVLLEATKHDSKLLYEDYVQFTAVELYIAPAAGLQMAELQYKAIFL